MQKSFVLLGSTGSIGVNALKVAKAFNLRVEAMSCGRNIELFNAQISEFKPKMICISQFNDLQKLDSEFLRQNNIKIFHGNNGLLEMISESKSSLVLNAIVGFAGLAPSLAVKNCGKRLALANKESLVSGGWLFENYQITPIDSEHFGLWYLQNSRAIKRLIITASGGALRNMPLETLKNATPAQALKHPNWSMGRKITIDSATMMNKMFEILEAFWLFGANSSNGVKASNVQNGAPDSEISESNKFSESKLQIDALIEESSSIHALAEFVDGSITAHIATADMKLPIAYALDSEKAKNFENLTAPFDLNTLSNLSLKPIDSARYEVWQLKDEILKYPKLGVVLNATNEIAVQKFLDSEICFGKIAQAIKAAISEFKSAKDENLGDFEDIKRLDSEVRKWAQKTI